MVFVTVLYELLGWETWETVLAAVEPPRDEDFTVDLAL